MNAGDETTTTQMILDLTKCPLLASRCIHLRCTPKNARASTSTPDQSQSQSYFTTDGQSVSQSVCPGVGHPFGARFYIFLLFCRKIALLFVLVRPL
jgi:hypothetical protein